MYILFLSTRQKLIPVAFDFSIELVNDVNLR